MFWRYHAKALRDRCYASARQAHVGIIMIVDAQVNINGSRAAIWAAINDIENAAKIISGIISVEIVNKPADGLVGLKWRETRMMFGQPATVEKWIIESVEHEFYKTRAESDGYIFLTTNRISDTAGGVILTSAHESLPQSMKAKLSMPMMLLFRGVIKKAILQDLSDIKSAVERA